MEICEFNITKVKVDSVFLDTNTHVLRLWITDKNGKESVIKLFSDDCLEIEEWGLENAN